MSRSFPQAAGVVVAAIGAFVLAGWVFDIPLLKSILPIWVSMKANTAIGFVLAGLSLWLLGEGKQRLAQVCAAAVALIGFCTLVEYLFGWDLGIDQLFFKDSSKAVETSHPGRMAPITAVNFTLLGLSLFLLGTTGRLGLYTCQMLALFGTFFSFLALLGYLFQAKPLYQIAAYTSMALHTAVTFFLLSLGLLFSRPDRGIMRVVTSESFAGKAARRLIPAAVVIPAALGWISWQGQLAGLYDMGFGLALMVVTMIVVLVGVVWVSTASLNRSERERGRWEEERNRFFNLSLDMLGIAGFDGYFKELNPMWEKTLGWTKDELLARPYIEFVHPEDRERTSREAEQLSHGLLTISFENRYLCRDGSYRWFQWTAFPVEEGRTIYAAARDITDRKRAEEEIRQKNLELESFSYSVSHDLRAPLRAIDGFSLALLEDCTDRLDEVGKDYLQRVRAATRQMAQLIDDLLGLSQVTRSEMRHERVDLSAEAKAIADELKKSEPDRKVEFVIAQGLMAEGDGRLLRVVLENLLRNAWKFTALHPSARIEFGSSRENGRPAFFIRDDGAGFDMTYADKLFGPFQRLHKADEFPGTGIGLATVQRVIHRHGGRVWAKGEVEKGAAFYFTIGG